MAQIFILSRLAFVAYGVDDQRAQRYPLFSVLRANPQG